MGHKRTIEAAEAGGKQYELALLYTDEAFFDLLEHVNYYCRLSEVFPDGQSKDKMVIYLPFHIYTLV